MPQRSTRVGNLTVTLITDPEKVRHTSRRDYASARDAIQAEVVQRELDQLSDELKQLPADDSEDHHGLVADLSLAYKQFFGSAYPSESDQQRVVNLELFILTMLAVERPWKLLEPSFERLENLYTLVPRGFKDDLGDFNPKLHEIGRDLKRRHFNMPWDQFPVLQTLMVPAGEMLEEKLSRLPRDAGKILGNFTPK